MRVRLQRPSREFGSAVDVEVRMFPGEEPWRARRVVAAGPPSCSPAPLHGATIQFEVLSPGESAESLAIYFTGDPEKGPDVVRANPNADLVPGPTGDPVYPPGLVLDLPESWYSYLYLDGPAGVPTSDGSATKYPACT